jgi:hypothetical protein
MVRRAIGLGRGTRAKEAGFAFDRVFDMESQQQDIFDWGVKGIVEGKLI